MNGKRGALMLESEVLAGGLLERAIRSSIFITRINHVSHMTGSRIAFRPVQTSIRE